MTIDNTSPGRLNGRQRLILFVLLDGSFMLSVDFSILNVALPRVGTGVGMERSDLPWITSAFALPAAGFTLLFGRLADLLGRRRMFTAGLSLLMVASMLGGLAANAEMLLVARALQGTATAMVVPAALSLITTTFAEGGLRDRALGLNGALASGGFTVGALAGGTLVGLLDWRAAFLINVPVALVILIVTPLVIDESIVPERVRLDVPGAVTVTAGLLATIYAITASNAVVAVVGVALLAAFWRIELRSPAPLAPVRVLRRPSVKWGNYAGFATFVLQPAVIFLTTLYLQDVLSFSPFTTGLIFGVPGLASVAAGVVGGRLIGRVGARAVLTTGMAVQGAAMLAMVFVGDDRGSLIIVLPALFIGFFAHVAAIVAYMVVATSGLPDEEQGLAGGLVSMTQKTALSVGTPMLSAVAATQSLELNGIRLAVGISAIAMLASAVLTRVGLRYRGSTAVPVDSDPAGVPVS